MNTSTHDDLIRAALAGRLDLRVHGPSIRNAARDRWLAVHPFPQLLDFACPRCKAQPGEPCRSPIARKVENGHKERQQRHGKAFNRHSLRAGGVGDELVAQLTHAARCGDERRARTEGARQ